jgi:hypothetical protein
VQSPFAGRARLHTTQSETFKIGPTVIKTHLSGGKDQSLEEEEEERQRLRERER